MIIMRFEIIDNSLDKISSDAAIVFAFKKGEKQPGFSPLEDFKKIDDLLAGQVTKICNLEKFSGENGETITVFPDQDILPSRIIVIGLGKKEEFIADSLRRAIGTFTQKMKKKIDSASLSIPGELPELTDLETITQVIGEGFLLGSYEFNKYKEKKPEEREFSSVIFSVVKESDKEVIFETVKKAELAVKATELARNLVNEPANVVTPAFLANFAQEIAKEHPKFITCKIYDKKQVEEMGMGAFLSIAKAAGDDVPPKFIHLEYHPERTDKQKKLAIVGKGITFDTGGINIKPGDHMIDMKIDMSGAAAVIGVFSVIAQVKPSFPVMGLIAATPNLVSATSTVPGDIAKASNGKTIEILNTDAEGRVTMADSISYAIKEGATEIIDLATLTGACMVALGIEIAGLFVNNRNLGDAIKAAAFEAGEKVWELPLEKDYKKLNKSSVADIANISNTRYGGAITAALFLEEFAGNTSWAHLDIAGPAFQNKPSEIGPKGGTGFGVRTLLNLLKEKNKV